MEMKDAKIRRARIGFLVVVALAAAAIAAVAGWVSTALGVSFGIVLLLAGSVIGGTGAWLAFPDPYDSQNPRNRVLVYINRLFFDRPNELAADQMAYDREHSAPLWGFEDVMVWVGLSDILIGILLAVLRR